MRHRALELTLLGLFWAGCLTAICLQSMTEADRYKAWAGVGRVARTILVEATR